MKADRPARSSRLHPRCPPPGGGEGSPTWTPSLNQAPGPRSRLRVQESTASSPGRASTSARPSKKWPGETGRGWGPPGTPRAQPPVACAAPWEASAGQQSQPPMGRAQASAGGPGWKVGEGTRVTGTGGLGDPTELNSSVL